MIRAIAVRASGAANFYPPPMKTHALGVLLAFTLACGDDVAPGGDGGPSIDAISSDGGFDATIDLDSAIRDALPDSAFADTAPDVDTDAGTQELKAFPSAYGAGAYATGGRGGSVYHVTSLLDDGSEGTLRWALGQTRPSTIVFDVSGTIDLESWLTLSGSDVTIAGQTAPVGGITITSTTMMRFRGQDISNFVVRYLRIRPMESGSDSFEFYGNNDGAHTTILDHISASYGGDESISLRGRNTHNITYQRCLIAEGKTGSLFGDSDSPEYSYDNSFLHSLFFNISHRTPNTSTNGRVDIINNVTQDWQYRLTHARGDTRLNHINNYYAMGHREGLMGNRTIQLNSVSSTYDHQIYTAGNIIDKGMLSDPAADNRVLWAEFEAGLQTTYAPASEFTDTPYALLGPAMEVRSATDAYANVIQDVGANASLNADGSVTYHTDANDTDYLRIMSEGEGAHERYEMYDRVRSWFGEQRYADFVATIGAEPINTRPSEYDADRDGMADEWESANFGGLDRNGQGDEDEDGYTDLEEFLNQVDAAR